MLCIQQTECQNQKTTTLSRAALAHSLHVHEKEEITASFSQGFHTLMNSRNTKTQILPALLAHTLRRSALPPLPGNNKARLANHLREILLLREPLNALHKILVAVPVRSHNLSNQRNRAERPALVHGVEERVIEVRREFQAREHAAGLQHAISLPERRVLVREIADSKGDGVEVYAGVRDGRQGLGVGFEEVDAAGGGVGCLGQALAALGEHFGVDVGDGDVRGGVAVQHSGVVEHAHGDVAGAARDVEDSLLFARGGGIVGAGGEVGADAWVEAADEVVFPEAVDAEGHEVVHGVVAAGDGGEDGGDWGSLYVSDCSCSLQRVDGCLYVLTF
jgi:hypothetical protein